MRLGVSPAAASTPTGVFNQRFEALFPRAGALGCKVCFAPLLFLPVYLCAKMGPRGLLAVALPAPFTPQSDIRPFEGNLEADVAPGENEFDTPALRDSPHTFSEKDTEDRGAIKYPLSELVIWAVWHFFSLSKCWAVPAIFAASIHSTSICWALLHWILRTEQQI